MKNTKLLQDKIDVLRKENAELKKQIQKPIRKIGIGIKSNEDPTDRDDRLYHEEQDEIAIRGAKK